MRKTSRFLVLAASVVLCAAIAIVVMAPFRSPASPLGQFGGIHLVYRVVPADGHQPTPAEMAAELKVVANRVNATGIAASSVYVTDGGSLGVDLPKLTFADSMQIRLLIGATGRLDFVPLGQTPVEVGDMIDFVANPPLFSGDQTAAASIGASQTGQRTVDITLKAIGAKLFADYTGRHLGDYVAITLDGKALTVPVIREGISDGKVQISQGGIDGFSLLAAQRLITILQFGPLPFPLHEVGAAEVTPAP